MLTQPIDDLHASERVARLLAPLEVGDFVAKYWKQKPYFAAASETRLTSTVSALQSTDVRWLLAQSPHITVWPQDLQKQAARASFDAAFYAYQHCGATVYFDVPENSLLRSWTAALANELGEAISVTSVLAVRAGHGSRPHYDRNDNFTVQLRGRKRWIVAHNCFIDYPVSNWEIGQRPPPHADASHVPSSMPIGEEYLLTPGSLLYVPRGYLHQVTATDDESSLSLNFNFADLCWAEVLLATLQSRLFQDVRLRKGVRGLFGAAWGREAFEQSLPSMLSLLQAGVATLEPRDLRPLLDDRDAFRRLLDSLRL